MSRISNRVKPLLEEKMKHTIMNAVVEIIIENGINEITTSKISKKAGIATGTIYNYFRDKNDILKQIIHRYFDGVQEDILCIIAEPLSVKDRLAKIASSVLSSFSKEKLLHRTLMCSLPPFHNSEEFVTHQRKHLQIITNLIQEGIDKKEYQATNALFMALIFRGSLREFVIMMMHDMIPDNPTENAQFIISQLFNSQKEI